MSTKNRKEEVMKVSQEIGNQAFIESMKQLKEQLCDERGGMPVHEYYNALLGIGMNFMCNLITRMKDVYKTESYTQIVNMFSTTMKFSLETDSNEKLH